jgi:hypothetical protein
MEAHAPMCGKQCVSCSQGCVMAGDKQNYTVPAPISVEFTAIGFDCDQDSLPVPPYWVRPVLQPCERFCVSSSVNLLSIVIGTREILSNAR